MTDGILTEIHAGVGMIPDPTPYTVTLTAGPVTRVYPDLSFQGRRSQRLYQDDPVWDTANAGLPEPFPLVAGDTLSVTLEGWAGVFQQLPDGRLRMTLVGAANPCPDGTCVDEMPGYSCQ